MRKENVFEYYEENIQENKHVEKNNQWTVTIPIRQELAQIIYNPTR